VRGEETLVTALDLEDAYNRVHYDILLRTLINMRISPTLIIWIGAAMLKRKVAMRLGCWASTKSSITPGLPQGSALSPVLFNVYTVGITSNQLEGPGRILSFADDVLIYRTGKDRQAVTEGVQGELDRIGTWCDEHNGKIHPGKAGVLWCSLNNRAVKATMPEVYINGQAIKREPNLRYLGIVFDRTLSGKDHITRVISKSRKGLNAVKTMARANMPQRILAILFQTLVLSVIDYGFGLLTLSKTQLNRLEVIQNEGMRAILGCTRDTSAAAMRHLLGFPSMKERHQLAQVRAFLRVSADPLHPLHHKVGRQTKSRLKRGTDWMSQAAQLIEECCPVGAIRRGRSWIRVSDEAEMYTRVIATLGRECREWPEGATHAEIETLIEVNCKPDDVTVFTDGSVQRGLRSGWAFTARTGGQCVQERSGATTRTTSSMCMEVKAITEALEWISGTAHQSITILTDSMSTLDKVRCGFLYADWITAITASSLRTITWIFCPGHAGVKGNERADQLAGTADITGSLTLDPPTVTALVRDHLVGKREDSSYTLELLKEKGVQSGQGMLSNRRNPSRRLLNQLLMETISTHTLRWTLLRRDEEIWMESDSEDSNSGIK